MKRLNRFVGGGVLTRSYAAKQLGYNVPSPKGRGEEDLYNNEVYKLNNIGYNSDMKHHYCFYKNCAFTLAEVLITLGIIGVVAALTMPALINNIQDKQFRTAFKKQYSVLSQALMLTYPSGNTIPVIGNDNYSDMKYHVCDIASNLKYTHAGIDCSTYESDPAKRYYWHKPGTWYTRQKLPAGINTGYLMFNFYMPDGAWINFNCYRDILIDVNGAKGPNIIGRDIYYTQLPIGKNNLQLGFYYSHVNACADSDSSFKRITKDNYEEDCKSGTGWGCSPATILN